MLALDGSLVRESLESLQSQWSLDGSRGVKQQPAARLKLAESLLSDGPDLLIWAGDDGTVAIRAIHVSDAICIVVNVRT